METHGQNGPGENRGSCSPPGDEDLDVHGALLIQGAPIPGPLSLIRSGLRLPPPASPRARVEEARSTALPSSLDRGEGTLPAGINPCSSDAFSSPHGFSGLSTFRLTWRITRLLRVLGPPQRDVSGVGAEIRMFPGEAETTRPDWELLSLGTPALPRFLAPSHPPE